jgi:hypothetical protein
MHENHQRRSGCVGTRASVVMLVAALGVGTARAQSQQTVGLEGDGQDGSGVASADPMPVPPGVEGAASPASYGGYCYVGPHPTDPRVSPGDTWDPTEGQHLRPYPPVDLRLFSHQNGCYYFIGDPHDFGYGGPAYSYYGAHPVLAAHGGGWCFMIGGHSHAWAPWSTQFAVVGPWYYWRGVYDPFFWTYWPYYSAYYRAYYPHYYGGGRFYRGGGYRAAPPLGRGYQSRAWAGPSAVSVAPVRPGAPLGRGGSVQATTVGPFASGSGPRVSGGGAAVAPARGALAAPAPGRPALAPGRSMPPPTRAFPPGGAFRGPGGLRGGRRQ